MPPPIPGVKLPDLPINVVVRADGSGTSFVFSKHLSAISPEFDKAVGVNTMPNWPVGTKSKGNEGVTASLKTTPGSIGYIEYGYAKSQKLATATLENKAGKYVAASTASGQAALASAESARQPDRLGVRSGCRRCLPDRDLHLDDLLSASIPTRKKLAALQDLLKYGLTDGQKDAEALGYIPLPANVVQQGTGGRRRRSRTSAGRMAHGDVDSKSHSPFRSGKPCSRSGPAKSPRRRRVCRRWLDGLPPSLLICLPAAQFCW